MQQQNPWGAPAQAPAAPEEEEGSGGALGKIITLVVVLALLGLVGFMWGRQITWQTAMNTSKTELNLRLLGPAACYESTPCKGTGATRFQQCDGAECPVLESLQVNAPEAYTIKLIQYDGAQIRGIVLTLRGLPFSQEALAGLGLKVSPPDFYKNAYLGQTPVQKLTWRTVETPQKDSTWGLELISDPGNPKRAAYATLINKNYRKILGEEAPSSSPHRGLVLPRTPLTHEQDEVDGHVWLEVAAREATARDVDKPLKLDPMGKLALPAKPWLSQAIAALKKLRTKGSARFDGRVNLAATGSARASTLTALFGAALELELGSITLWGHHVPSLTSEYARFENSGVIATLDEKPLKQSKLQLQLDVRLDGIQVTQRTKEEEGGEWTEATIAPLPGCPDEGVTVCLKQGSQEDHQLAIEAFVKKAAKLDDEAAAKLEAAMLARLNWNGLYKVLWHWFKMEKNRKLTPTLLLTFDPMLTHSHLVRTVEVAWEPRGALAEDGKVKGLEPEDDAYFLKSVSLGMQAEVAIQKCRKLKDFQARQRCTAQADLRSARSWWSSVSVTTPPD